MPLSDNGRNAMLTGGLGNVIAYISLHSGDPGTTGANELAGGSPAYARKAVAWNAAAAGVRTNSGQLDFDVAAGSTVYHVGLWSAVTAGTFYGYFVVGGFLPQVAVAPAASDVFTSYAHGLQNGDQVLVYDVQQAGMIGGLTEGTPYFVINRTADTFQLSATSGGAAVNGTTDGEVVVQKVLPEVFASQGVYSIAAGALALNAQFV